MVHFMGGFNTAKGEIRWGEPFGGIHTKTQNRLSNEKTAKAAILSQDPPRTLRVI